jgi:hypothetical protein
MPRSRAVCALMTSSNLVDCITGKSPCFSPWLPAAFFGSRHLPIATLAARDRILSAGVARSDAAAGMLMSYGPDLTKMYHQLGVYTGNILKGAKPC